MAREKWNVTNTTSKNLSIGDLKFCPVIEPGKTVDLLRYHSYSEIEQSSSLVTLLNAGWLALNKRKTSSNVKVNRMEEDEVNSKDSEVTSSLTSYINARDFLDLTDTPSSYSGNESKVLAVRPDGLGIAFTNVTTGSPDSLDDIPDVTITSPQSRQRLFYDADSGQWINGSNEEEITDVSATGTISTTTGVYLVDTSGGSVVLTIPDASANNAADRMRFFKVTSDANTVTVQTTSSQNIGSTTTQLIAKPNHGFSIISDTDSWKIIQSNRTPATRITVAAAGGDFTTIEAALTFANLKSPSTSNPIAIELSPGSYTESNPIIIPEHIHVVGIGEVVINASTTTDAIFQFGVSCSIENISVDGASGSGGIGFEFTGDGSDTTVANIVNCTATNCEKGFVSNSGVLNKVVSCDGCRAVGTSSAPMTYGYVATNGSRMSCNNSNALGDPSTGTDLDAAFRVESDNSFLRLIGCSSRFADNGILMVNGSRADALSCRFTDCDDGVEISATGSNAELDLLGCVFSGNGTYDLNILQTSSTIELGNSIMDDDLIYFAPGVTIQGAFANQKEGDEGLDVRGELHVGSPDNPRESVLGGGDSYTRGMLVYTYNGSTYTDVSTAAKSASGSTFAVPGTTTNNAIYVSSDLQSGGDYLKFFGIKTKVSTALVAGSGAILSEYWNGSTWVSFNTMETYANSPYTSNANSLFLVTGDFQIRFNWQLQNLWTKNDPPSTGTNRYWMRFRVSSGITTAPVFEQFKLHSCRTEINSDGYVEYFGQGRPLKKLDFDQNAFAGTQQSPADQDLFLSDNLVLGRVENSFQNNATDEVGLSIFLPYDLDTSSPIRLISSFTVDGGTANGTQAIKFTIYWNISSNGNSVYRSTASAPSSTGEQSTTFTYTVQSGDEDKMISGYVDLTIPTAKATRSASTGVGDLLWITIKRDSSDVSDTWAGDVNIINFSPFYTSWNNGLFTGQLTS